MNSVYIGVSIDGFISDKSGGLEWLDSVPNPDGDDMGYFSFLERMDALLMGRNTFETVCNFDVDWPYKKPVYVLSSSMQVIPPEYAEKAFLVKGDLNSVLETIHQNGHHNVYIDGGKTVQSFLKADLLDELIITTIPILLGGGTPLFGELEQPLNFELVSSKTLLDQIVQRHYKRIRKNS